MISIVPTRIRVVVECWCLASRSMPPPNAFKSAWEKVGDTLKQIDGVQGCSDCIILRNTVRSCIPIHIPQPYISKWQNSEWCFSVLCFLIVFSLKKKTAVQRERKKSCIVQKQIMVQQVSSTSGTHCRVYYFQKPLSFRRPCSEAPAGRNPLMLHMRLGENPVWDGLSFCNRPKSKLPVDMKPFFVL